MSFKLKAIECACRSLGLPSFDLGVRYVRSVGGRGQEIREVKRRPRLNAGPRSREGNIRPGVYSRKYLPYKLSVRLTEDLFENSFNITNKG